MDCFIPFDLADNVGDCELFQRPWFETADTRAVAFAWTITPLRLPPPKYTDHCTKKITVVAFSSVGPSYTMYSEGSPLEMEISLPCNEIWRSGGNVLPSPTVQDWSITALTGTRHSPQEALKRTLL